MMIKKIYTIILYFIFQTGYLFSQNVAVEAHLYYPDKFWIRYWDCDADTVIRIDTIHPIQVNFSSEKKRVNCGELIKADLIHTYDTFRQVMVTDTIFYYRICSMGEPNESIYELKKAMLYKGKKFDNYMFYSLYQEFPIEQLYFAQVMAFKYGNGKAYERLIKIYRRLFFNWEDTEERYLDQMIWMLRSAAQKGSRSSKRIIHKYLHSKPYTKKDKIKALTNDE